MQSISTKTPLGRAETSTQALAGGFSKLKKDLNLKNILK